MIQDKIELISDQLLALKDLWNLARLSCLDKNCNERIATGYITAYDLRHSFATQFSENNGNVFSLQRILGHSNLNITRRYVHFSQDYITEQHSIPSPINNI